MTNAVTLATLGNGPAFNAYLSNNQSVNQNTNTKVLFDTERFDTNNNFDTSTSRFTPTVAGYYQVNLNIFHDYTGSYAAGSIKANIYKNGSNYIFAQLSNATSGYAYGCYSLTALIYMNGSTDYLEAYGTNPNPTGSAVFDGGATVTNFSACLVRGA